MTTPARRPTIHDVAAAAGVSIATASRVLSGGVASGEARERVTAAAIRVNYVANAHARSLRRERTMTVGIAFFSLQLPGALDMLESLSRTLDDHGYTLLISDTAGDSSRFEHLLGRYRERRVDALICVNPDKVGPVLARIVDDGVPTAALMSRGRGAGALPLFAPNLEPAAAVAIQRLVELGHRRVLALLPGGDRGAFRAIWAALAASPLDVQVENPFVPGFSTAPTVEAVRAPHGPTAVITTYPLALALLRAFRAGGLGVPADVSLFAGTGDARTNDLLETPLSAIDVDLGAFGRAVAEAMLAWLDGQPPPRNTLVPVSTWAERATTGPAPAHAGESPRRS